MMSTYKTLVFDFDGTIADSLSVLLRAYSSLAEELSLKELSEKDVDKIRNLPPRDILKFVGVPLYRLPEFLLKGRAKYKEFMSDLEPIVGITYVLIELQKLYPLHILTSNDQDVVLSFLDTHKITCFESVTSERNIFGKDKSLKKVMKLLDLNPKSVLYIGDEVRDIEACRRINLDICSVSWGLNTHEILDKHHPTYLIRDPRELLDLLV